MTLNFESEGSHTFLIDLPVLILFGGLFALFAKRSESSVFKNKYFWHGLVFTTIFNAAVLFAAIEYPDWMWMYFIESSQNTWTELTYLFIFLYYLPYIFGFVFTLELKKLGSLWVVLFLAICALSEVWIVMHLFDRYSQVGTYDQFHAGQALSLFEPVHSLSAVMNIAVGIMILDFIFVLLLYRKELKHEKT